MKSNKITVRLLLLLGFGGTVGLLGSCGANRAQKSRTADPAPEPVEVQDSVVPIRVMYGVPAVRFDPDKPMLRRAMGRMITGSVTDADSGDALHGVLVEAVTESKEIFAITDPRGRYSIQPTLFVFYTWVTFRKP